MPLVLRKTLPPQPSTSRRVSIFGTSRAPTPTPVRTGGGLFNSAASRSTTVPEAPVRVAPLPPPLTPAQVSASAIATTSGPTVSYATDGGDSVPPSTGGGQTDQFDAVIEGQRTIFGSLQAATDFVATNTHTGDRFEILVNGQSTGLKIRTDGGSISVPDDQAANVRAMTHDDIVSTLQKATAAAAPAAPSGGGGIPWPLILTGGGAAALAFFGRKHR
jgi:hypothetical protein